MKVRRLACMAIVSALSITGAAHGAAKLAITEFMVDPNGTDLQLEWYEIFNYGMEPVNVAGFTLKDNASAVYTFPDYTIPSGGYVVVAQNGIAFTNRWLGGVADSRVLSTVAGTSDGVFQLNNSSDGLYLKDDSGAVLWSLGYDGGYTQYRSIFLAVDDFSITNYGQPPQSGNPALINTNGQDGTTPATLGYESNTNTADAFARSSSVAAEIGSPLQGGYTVVPESTTLGLAAPILGAALSRRRR